MKVLLTNRKNVDAEGKWYKVFVSEQAIRIMTDFGLVNVVRVRNGLEVTLRPTDPKQTVVELGTQLQREPLTATLRPIGAITVGEMDNPGYRAVVDEWLGQPPAPKETLETLSGERKAELKRLIRAGQRLEAIKRLREITNCGVLEARNYSYVLSPVPNGDLYKGGKQ